MFLLLLEKPVDIDVRDPVQTSLHSSWQFLFSTLEDLEGNRTSEINQLVLLPACL